MDTSAVVTYLGPRWTRTVELMQEALRSDIDLLNRTNGELFSHRGKMLRPMLSLLVSGACSAGDVPDESCRYAAAAELLHNATLLHDDVADQSSLRRGRPTVSSILGPNASVLIGDFWLVKAIEMILDKGVCNDEIIRIFAKTLSDLAEGEMFQLQKAQTVDTSVDDYYRIIYSKTASLFEASCVSAAISVGAPLHLRDAAREYGKNLGMAFQIKDDILDYVSDEALGKPVGSDLKEKKVTMPLLAAFSTVSVREEQEMRLALKESDAHPQDLDVLRDFVLRSGGMKKAEQTLDEFVGQAKKALEAFPESHEKEFLMQLSDFTASRTI